MSDTIPMPKLSPTMKEGTIAKWHFKEGDKVEDNSVLLEVETDKATVEYRNVTGSFYLRKILVKEREKAKLGQPIAITSQTADEKIDDLPAEEPSKEQTPKETTENKQAEAPKESVPVKSSFMEFVPEEPLKGYSFPSKKNDPILASPLAKKLAKEKGLDLSTVHGSGPNGRIMSRDLDLTSSDTIVAFGRDTLPKETPGSYEENELSAMQNVIAQRMQGSKSSVPHFYLEQAVYVDNLLQIKSELKSCNIRITINDFVIRAVSLSLRKHKEVNSGFNSKSGKFIQFKTVDVAVAVNLPNNGLITPIIRHADFKNLGQISLEMKDLKKKALNGKLKEEEYKGGSFTISNLGAGGVDKFIAIISPPQSAILAVASIKETAVVKEGKIVVANIMNLSLSCDHRVINGAKAAMFLGDICSLLENPSLLLV